MKVRLVPFENRPRSSVFSVDEYKYIAYGKYLTKFKSFPMQKDPLTLEIYRSLLNDKKFGSIIEFGTLYGSSAAWMAHHSPDSKILSLDIDQNKIAKEFKDISNIEFKYFDAFNHDQLDSMIQDLPKPWLIVEDCHQNVLNLLNTCYKYFKTDDYVIIEDTNPLGPAKPLINGEPYVEFGDEKLNIAREFGKKSRYFCRFILL